MTDISLELLKLIFILAFSFGFWTCMSLLLTRKADSYIRWFLIVYLMLLMIQPLNAYLHLISDRGVKFFTLLSQTLSWAYGPLLLLLVNSLLLKKLDPIKSFLHFIPFAIWSVFHLLEQSFPPYWFYVSCLYLQIGTYLSLTIKLCIDHKLQLKRLNKHYANTSYYWAMHLSIGLVVLMVWDLLIVTSLVFNKINDLSFNTLLASLYAIYISCLALLFIRQPQFSSVNDETLDEINSIDSENETGNQSLRIIELTPDLAEQIRQQLETLSEAHQIYLDSDISLGKLASMLNITTHQLSELFNVHMQTTYYEYINHLRYEESLKHLQNSYHDYSVTDIAYRSGFNNRSSFYRVFKEKTGMTPTEYKTRLIANR